MPNLPHLFSPVSLGALACPNRVIMAPLTRARATPGNVPTPMMAEYYRQRADCGLIVSEATAVDPLGMGWYRVPGIWTEEMSLAWRQVTGAVHAAGGRIVCQLWHMGRLVLPEYIGGAAPLAPSAIAGEGQTFLPPPSDYASGFLPMADYALPRPMDQADIDHAVSAYGRAAANAREAGFDGIEIHGANGYLIDQFLQTRSNTRTDGYGGSVENRLRFLGEVMAATAREIDPARTGLRISPTSERKGMGDADPTALAEAIGRMARDAGLAYIHLIEAVAPGFTEPPANPVIDRLREAFGGPVIQNGGFTAASADACIAAGRAQAVSFGRPFIANPDLVDRMKHGHALAEADFDYAYVGDARGYTDYPRWAPEA